MTPVFYSDKEKTFESVFVDNSGSQKRIRGIVTTSSYEARAFGVKTAMPLAQALQLCPTLTVIPSNYPLYHRLSFALNEYMQSKIPKIEQYSIDEFFGDVSGWIADEDVYAFAVALQTEVLDQFDIPVSIGISKAKWISKLATESAKPYGVYQVDDIDAYIKEMPIKAFPGIGKAFQERLKSYGIQTLGDIKKLKSLFYSWKKPGIQLYHRVTGTDDEGINEKSDRKSVGISRTFDAIHDVQEVKRRLLILARNITYIVMQLELNPTTYYVKINYEYNVKVKRSWRVDRIFSEQLFKSELSSVYEEIHNAKLGAIKISVNVTNFTSEHPKTLSLLDLESDMMQNKISHSVFELRGKYGIDIIKNALEL